MHNYIVMELTHPYNHEYEIRRQRACRADLYAKPNSGPTIIDIRDAHNNHACTGTFIDMLIYFAEVGPALKTTLRPVTNTLEVQFS